MKTLLLVDGSSYLYRAFHKLPDLRNARGEPTGAIYGVLNMLRRLVLDYKPDYLACVFDAKGKTFRDDAYPAYKANRSAMPDELAQQIEPLHEAIRALGWPVLIVPGVEADDVIGTLARQATASGVAAVISTGDKDLTQLVDQHVTLINTMSNEKLDIAGVKEKFGVPPERIVDYLTLIGDSVDNVPGVEKVGPKTAVKWLAEYDSLDNVIAHANDIDGAAGENLRKALDWLPQARKLLTVQCDVALPLGLDQLHLSEPDRPQLANIFDRLEFKAWRRELESTAASNTVSVAVAQDLPRHYECVLNETQLEAWLALISTHTILCIDTETTSLDPHQADLVGLSLCVEAGRAAYIPLAHRYAGVPEQLNREQVLARIKPLLEDARVRKIGQNLKYDMHVLVNHGIKLNGVEHDTLLQSYVLESDKPHDMDSMAARHLNTKTITYHEVAGKGVNQINFEQVPIERATEYAAEDADITLRLHQHLYPRLSEDAKLAYIYRDIEIPVMEVLFKMERNGVLLNTDVLKRQSEALGQELSKLMLKAHELAGEAFNINSTKQIQEILYTRMKLPVLKKTPGGAPSTDEDVLEQLALDYPLAKLILDFRGLAKLKSTYTDKLPLMVHARTGRVHTNYAQAVAVTGRLASNDPNLQNIPVRTAEGRRVREAFIAAQGSQLVSADYSQIELRIMAHLSSDASLLKAFAAGEDIHRATAAEIFALGTDAVTNEQRRYAKVINFGLIYGMSAFGLAAQLGIERSAAKAYIDRYFARYPGVAAYMQRTRESARNLGYIETVFGRRLFLPEIKSGNPARRQCAERAAINAPMQGTAADLIKLAMIQVQRWIERECPSVKLIMQVHDELVLEVPAQHLDAVKAQLPNIMTNVAQLSVPLVVDVGVGPNWEQAH
jgi:DNA polymerase I